MRRCPASCYGQSRERIGARNSSTAAGGSSRYTTITLLGAVGLYWGALTLAVPALRIAAATAVVTLIFIGTFSALDTEFQIGARTARERLQMREVLADWRNRSDGDLTLLYPNASTVKERAPMLERLGYSVFRTQRSP